jgi:hypothetical protein
MIRAGNIIRVRKGAAVHHGNGEVKRQRQDYVTVVYSARIPADGMDEAVVAFEVGDDLRDVNEGSVDVLDDRVHLLRVGNRQVRGGAPIRGGGLSYTTKGSCSCGRRCWVNGSTARDVRQRWRDHITGLVDPVHGEYERAALQRDLDDAAEERRRFEERRAQLKR